MHTKNLKGACVLPGFIEPHLYLLLTALAKRFLVHFSPLQVDSCDAAESPVEEKLANVKDADPWVAGYGWDPSRVPRHYDPNIDLLNTWSKSTIDGKQVSVPFF